MTRTLPTLVESTADDLGILRSLLDLSLQPLERFDGFEQRDQIATGAYRYQLNFICYALAMAQLTRTPAFTGYLADAQRHLILKMCDKRVWGYWANESLLGYLRRQTDPITHANVMYSGYFGVMLGMYQTLNQDNAFDEPGSLSLRWSDDIVHHYDSRRLAVAIRDNMLANPKCPQYPCEPHLIYPICNTFALNTLVMYDRLHGETVAGDLVAKVRKSYHNDGWLRNGRFIPVRLGRSINLSPPVLGSDAGMALWLHAIMPDIAQQSWDLLRTKHIRVEGDSTVSLRGSSRLRFDAGNYRFANGEANTKTVIMNVATEFGADDIAAALSNDLDSELETVWAHGARRFRGLSNLVNAMYALARFSRAGGFADLIGGQLPSHWRTGPVLAEAAYPDVLVGAAVTDGTALDLVLHPGNGPCRSRLGIRRLRPRTTYRVIGAVEDTVTADDSGRGHLDVDLSTRTAVAITPTDA